MMWLLDPIARWLGRGVLTLFPSVTVSGIKTIFADLNAPRDACLKRLSASIETLRAVDARRGEWLTRYVRYITIWGGHYSLADHFGGVHIATEFLLEAEIERIAGVIVHEATHHRLKRFGIETTQRLQARIETICVREQADFLRKFGERGRGWAEELEQALMHPWWGDIPENVNMDLLVEQGLPRPIAWLMRRRIQRAT